MVGHCRRHGLLPRKLLETYSCPPPFPPPRSAASFAICELDLAGVVDPQVLDTFGPWLAQRAVKRSQRAKLAARKDRRAPRAAATFEQTRAYPQPQAPPPAIDAEGFVQLCEGPSPGTSPVQRPAGPPGGVSYARLTKEGLAATGPTLSGAPVGSEPPPTVELRGVWAASTKSGGAGSKTGAASGASISDMQSLSVTKKGKKTVLNLGQRRY